MRLSGPFSLNVMRSFRGAVDLYYYKGVPVARKWPSAPVQPGTPAQKTTWTSMRRMHAIIRDSPQQWRDYWKNTDLPVASTVQSLMRKTILWLLAKNVDIQIPEIDYVSFSYNDPPTETTVTIQVLGPASYDGTQVRWRVGFPTGPNPPRMKWTVAAFTRDREFHYKPASHPDVSHYPVAETQSWNNATKQHTIVLSGYYVRVGLLLSPS